MKQLVVILSALLVCSVLNGQDAVDDSSWLVSEPIEERLEDSLISVYDDTAVFLGFDLSMPDVISCGFVNGEDTVFYDCDDRRINCFLAANVNTEVVLEIYEWRLYFEWLGVNTISRRVVRAQNDDLSTWDMTSLEDPVTPEDSSEAVFCDSLISALDIFSIW